MIDKHHAAHYFIAGVIALVGLGGGYKLANAPPKLVNIGHATRHTADLWEPLSDDQTKALTAALSKTSVTKLVIFCGSPKCDDAADDFAEAARAAGILVVREVPIDAPPGFSLGSRDVQTTRALAAAVAGATGMEAQTVTGNFNPYIAFGARS